MPARNVKAAADAQKAMQLRILGYTYDHIAQECGYSGRSAAFTAVQRELNRTMPVVADDLRTIESERLDALLRVFMVQALKGNQGAADRVLRIMERRAKLYGLEVVKTEHLGQVGLSVSYVNDWRGGEERDGDSTSA